MGREHMKRAEIRLVVKNQVFWVLQSLIKFASGMSSSARSIPSLENFLVRTRRPPSTLTTRRTSTRTRCRRRTKQSQERHSTPTQVSATSTQKSAHTLFGSYQSPLPIRKLRNRKCIHQIFVQRKRPKMNLGFLFKNLFCYISCNLLGIFCP